MRLAAAILFLLLMMFGCAAPPPAPDLASPVPGERLRALEVAPPPASARDLALLIEQLQSSDPAVRMLAADRLRTAAGEDFGFRYDAPAEERHRAVLRWAQWLRRHAAAEPDVDPADAPRATDE